MRLNRGLKSPGSGSPLRPVVDVNCVFNQKGWREQTANVTVRKLLIVNSIRQPVGEAT